MSNNDYAMRVSSDDDEGNNRSSSSSSSASASHSPAEPSSSSGWAAFLAKETKAQATTVAEVACTQDTAPGNTALDSAVDISNNNNNDRTSSSPAQAVTSATTNSTATTKVKLSFGLPAFALPQTHVPTRTTPLPPTIPSTASPPPVNAPPAAPHVKQGEESKDTIGASVARADANMAVKAAVEEEKTDAHVTHATTTNQPARQEEQQQLCNINNEGLLQQMDTVYEAKLARASSSLASATTTDAPDFDVALLTELLQLTRQTLTSDAVSHCASNDAAALKTPPASSTAQNTTQDDKTQPSKKDLDDYRTAMLARLGLQRAVVEEWSWTGVTADVPTSAEGGNNTASRRQTSEKHGTWDIPLQSYCQADMLRCDKDDEQSSTESDVAFGEAAMPAEVLTVLQLEQRQRRSDEVQHEQLSDILRAA